MGYDARRAVEIDVRSDLDDDRWELGSGYRITEHLVLSCAHIFGGSPGAAAPRTRMRDIMKRSIGRPVYCWHDTDLDLSLWALADSPRSEGTSFGAVRIGSLPAHVGGSLDFTMYGWPRMTNDASENLVARQGHEACGALNLADWQSASNATGMVPLRPDDIATNDRGSWWGGMSGAAVFCSDVLVGIQIHDPNPEAAVRLAAVPADRLLAEPTAAPYLAIAGIDLRSTEVRHGIQTAHIDLREDDLVRNNDLMGQTAYQRSEVQVMRPEKALMVAQIINAVVDLEELQRSSERDPKDGQS